DRVAKALETYDSVMVRRDLEADGGFADFFRRPGEGEAPEAAAAARTGARGLTDGMGQLNHLRGGRFGSDGSAERGDGRLARPEDARRLTTDETPVGAELVDSLGQVNKRMPLVGKVPPWKQPPKPVDPAAPPAPRPFAWLAEANLAASAKPAGAAGDASGPLAGSESSATITRGALQREGPPATLGSGSSEARSIPSHAHAGMHSEAGFPAISPELLGAVRTAHRLSVAGELESPGSEAVALGPEPAPGPAQEPGPSKSGMWEEAPQSPPAVRPGRRGDDEGGPGDTPASVAWLRAGRGTGYGTERRVLQSAQATVDGRAIDPESGALASPARRTDASTSTATDRLGRPHHWAQPDNIRGGIGVDRIGRADPHRDALRAGAAGASTGADRLGRADPHSSVARVEPEPAPQPRGGSTVGMSDWERWLEFCARIDGFPRHLSIHSGGMLVTAAPLIDIAPIERATMVDRVVVQFDKRDVEELKLIKLDLLGLGMLAAIDETIQLIEHDCGTCVVLDAIPEQVPEVFEMVQAADTVGVFQIESRAQMQTLPKSRPKTLDDLVVEVAIIRPGPIQGNAVHPYLRRKQGLEPVTYLHPSLEPVLRDSMGVILYQEQVMRIAIEVAGFSPAESDGFRRAMGTWRSNREMEKLHQKFHDGCLRQPGMTEEIAEELFRQVSAFASFGFAKSHAAAFARTAYESSFLKLFYPAQFLVGLVNAQPMGFYPVEVLVNDAKRHGVSVLPVDINRSTFKTTTEWVGRPGWALAGAAGDDGSQDDPATATIPGEPLPEGCGIEAYARPVRSSSCVIPGAAARERWANESAVGWGVRLGLGLVKGIGEQHEALLDRELEQGPYASLADVGARTGLPEETIERLIRTGALDSLGRPRRELLWQLREVAGSARGRVDGKA
ncbi:MAG TPA: hypothetical protein VF484_00110, partial [Candidatus Limnocylindrales bacterium]